MAGDEYRLTLSDRAIGHVEPLHQLGAIGHGRDQFPLRQQGIHPAGEPMLANGAEGFGQFVAALVQTIAASLGVRLAVPRGTGDDGFQCGQQIIWLRSGLAQTVAAIDQ